MSFNDHIKSVFSGFRPSAQFIALNGYQNAHGEVANYHLLWNISYEECVKKSFDKLKNLDIGTVPLNGFTFDDLRLAGIELLTSYKETLVVGPGNNHLYNHKDTYDLVYDVAGQVIKGLALHKKQDILHMTGVYRIKKKIIIPGVYKKVNSKPKTLAKNALRNITPLARWGQFKLEPGNFIDLVVDKHHITFDNNEA